MRKDEITLWGFRNQTNAKGATAHTLCVRKRSDSCCSIKCLVMFQHVRWLSYVAKAQTMTDPQSRPKTFLSSMECCWSRVDSQADCPHLHTNSGLLFSTLCLSVFLHRIGRVCVVIFLLIGLHINDSFSLSQDYLKDFSMIYQPMEEKNGSGLIKIVLILNNFSLADFPY